MSNLDRMRRQGLQVLSPDQLTPVALSDLPRVEAEEGHHDGAATQEGTFNVEPYSHEHEMNTIAAKVRSFDTPMTTEQLMNQMGMSGAEVGVEVQQSVPVMEMEAGVDTSGDQRGLGLVEADQPMSHEQALNSMLNNELPAEPVANSPEEYQAFLAERANRLSAVQEAVRKEVNPGAVGQQGQSETSQELNSMVDSKDQGVVGQAETYEVMIANSTETASAESHKHATIGAVFKLVSPFGREDNAADVDELTKYRQEHLEADKDQREAA